MRDGYKLSACGGSSLTGAHAESAFSAGVPCYAGCQGAAASPRTVSSAVSSGMQGPRKCIRVALEAAEAAVSTWQEFIAARSTLHAVREQLTRAHRQRTKVELSDAWQVIGGSTKHVWDVAKRHDRRKVPAALLAVAGLPFVQTSVGEISSRRADVLDTFEQISCRILNFDPAATQSSDATHVAFVKVAVKQRSR